MIVFKKVTVKNFFSVGNRPIEISLNTHRKTLVSGSNGCGKSAIILDAINFALFNKPYKSVNKSQIINSINQKDCLVELEFTVNNVEYTIRRGIKPTVFDIIVNGQELDKESHNRDFQNYLETNVLRLNEKSFQQLVVLGSGNYIPFMRLPLAHRREIIEDILDLSIFSKMKEVLKEKISTNKTQVLDSQATNNQLNDKKKLIENFIKSLEVTKDKNTSELKDKIKTIEETISKNLIQIDSLKTKLKPLPEPKEGLSDRIGVLDRELSTLEYKLKTTDKNQQFFMNNEKCNTCGQDIKDRTSIIANYKIEIDELTVSINTLKNEKEGLLEKRRAGELVERENSKVENDIAAYENEINYQNRLKLQLDVELSKPNNNDKLLKENKNDLEKVKEELKEQEKVLNKLVLQKKYLDYVNSLVSDSGVKNQLVKKYIPIINKLMNEYLTKFGLSVNFTLDENFEEKIKSRYRDIFSYENFSEGQKARIDLSLMFTWREIAKNRNTQNTNLLIMDEVFDGSLDANATTELINIVDKLENTNTIIITHKDSSAFDNFERAIEVQLVNGFTNIK